MGLISKPDIFQTKPQEKSSFLVKRDIEYQIKQRSEISRKFNRIYDGVEAETRKSQASF